MYDPRLHLAMEIYNRAMTQGLRDGKGNGIDLKPRHCGLPFGKLEIKTDSTGFNYGGYRLAEFVSAGDYKTRGLRNHYRKARYRRVLAGADRADSRPSGQPVAFAECQSSCNGFLAIRCAPACPEGWFGDRPDRALRRRSRPNGAGSAPASCRWHPIRARRWLMDCKGRHFWDFEIAGFRRGDFTLFGKKAEGELLFTSPWQPGRIPVVCRSWHGLQPGPLGANVQRTAWGPQCRQPLSVLVLHLQQRQPP